MIDDEQHSAVTESTPRDDTTPAPPATGTAPALPADSTTPVASDEVETPATPNAMAADTAPDATPAPTPAHLPHEDAIAPDDAGGPDEDAVAPDDATEPALSPADDAEGSVRRTPRRSFRNRERGWFMQTPPRAQPRGSEGEAGNDAAQGGMAAPPQPGSLRYVAAAIVAVVLIVIALTHALGVGSSPQAAPTATAPPAPTTPPSQFNPTSGPPVQVKRVLGQAAGLSAPREAVPLPNGQLLVADTGNSRLAVLDAAGRLLRSDHGGATALQEPYALAATASHLYVLDAKGESIEQYSPTGHFQRELIHDPAMQDGRGLAAAPNGDLYVANPLINSIVVVSPNGAVIQKLSSSLGAASGQFNQPSDVAVGPDGTLYVLDNQNGRIEVMKPSGAFIRAWPAPQSDTLHSVHLLALHDGRVLASDPSGALVVYKVGEQNPTRLPLGGAGQAVGSVQPLGLALLPGGDILVTDGNGNRVLVVALPAA